VVAYVGALVGDMPAIMWLYVKHSRRHRMGATKENSAVVAVVRNRVGVPAAHRPWRARSSSRRS